MFMTLFAVCGKDYKGDYIEMQKNMKRWKDEALND